MKNSLRQVLQSLKIRLFSLFLQILSRGLAFFDTILVVPALLKLYRMAQSVYPAAGCYPLQALLNVAHGFAVAKTVVTASDYEEMLLAVYPGHILTHTELIHELGAVASEKTLLSLLDLLWMRGRDIYGELASHALVHAGSKAHRPILKSLMDVPRTKTKQNTIYKNALFEILKQTGDESCLEPIHESIGLNPDLSAQGWAVIKHILSRRSVGDQQVYTRGFTYPIKTIPETQDVAVDGCFRLPFPEEFDYRNWRDLPLAQELMNYVNSGDLEKGMLAAQALQSAQPDFYFSYLWSAEIFNRQLLPDQARAVLELGLRQAKSKYHLYPLLASTYLSCESIKEALTWWIRSLVLSRSLGQWEAWAPLLYVSYVADQLQCKMERLKLLSWLDRVHPEKVRLRAKSANRIAVLMRTQGSQSMKTAVELLSKHYIPSPPEWN